MNVLKNIAAISGILLLLNSCGKDLDTHLPIENDPTVPLQVSNLQVTNGNGNATISYKLPDDSRLMFVKAVYKITTGQQYETKASYYNNTLLVQGFADTLEHEVTIISVSRSNVESAPLTVKIKPLVAPIWQVQRSIQVINAFGGYNLAAANVSKSDISIIVVKKNVFNEYEADNNQSIYTNADSVLNKIRGLDTSEYRFGFLVKDRWGNKTDTMFKSIKPLYETLIPKTNYNVFNLPGDASQVTNGAALVYAWDNRLGWPYTSFTNQQGTGGTNPHMISFDMGALAKVSRVYIRPFPEGNLYYYLSTMKRFEIYGSAAPNLNGALDNTWRLLGSYTLVKPSGLAYGTDNAADQAAGAAGFSWEADVSAPKVRYIRIRCLENFAGGTNQSINELAVYGDPR